MGYSPEHGTQKLPSFAHGTGYLAFGDESTPYALVQSDLPSLGSAGAHGI